MALGGGGGEREHILSFRRKRGVSSWSNPDKGGEAPQAAKKPSDRENGLKLGQKNNHITHWREGGGAVNKEEKGGSVFTVPRRQYQGGRRNYC